MSRAVATPMVPKQLTMVTAVFPRPGCPTFGAFNANLALEFKRQGVALNVIAVRSALRGVWEVFSRVHAGCWDFSGIEIVSAPTLQFGRWCPLPARWRGVLGSWFAHGAIARRLNRTARHPEIIYAVFADTGLACLPWCQRHHRPLFVELPESSFDLCLQVHSRRAVRRLLEGCHGIIADSIDNLRFCEETLPGCDGKVTYVPNAADTRRFRPMDRAEVRRRLGLPERERIAVFCGHFIERKGPLRVLEGLQRAGGIRGVFLGQGPQIPTGPLVLRAAPVKNEELPLWMNAGDVFVLPSLAEGLANVIVEAMACGLPLVVSDRSFNRNFLTEEEAVFVDPESPAAIASGIGAVLNDPARRVAMSSRVVHKSAELSMIRRVERIRAFMDARLNACPLTTTTIC